MGSRFLCVLADKNHKEWLACTGAFWVNSLNNIKLHIRQKLKAEERIRKEVCYVHVYKQCNIYTNQYESIDVRSMV